MSYPRRRTTDLHFEEVDSEIVVYDTRTDVATRLNPTAALVWEFCDGERSVEDLVELLRAKLGSQADEDLVQITLDDLQRYGLLEDAEARDADANRQSRRRFIRTTGSVGAAAMLLPVIQAITAPTAAMAASSSTTVPTSTFPSTTFPTTTI
jgi:coenzyme PQQ synthesis protein D (PqqD)